MRELHVPDRQGRHAACKEARGCKVPEAEVRRLGAAPVHVRRHSDHEVGDLARRRRRSATWPTIKRTLEFAVRKRNVLPRGSKRLWITEFAWFSNPPGSSPGRPAAGRRRCHATPPTCRRRAYRLWRLGFSASSGTGSRTRTGVPRGPLLGQRRRGASRSPRWARSASRSTPTPRVAACCVWGIVSRGGRTTVRIERQAGSGWKRVADVAHRRAGHVLHAAARAARAPTARRRSTAPRRI